MFVPAASALGMEGNISRAMHCTVFQNSPEGPNTWKTRLARAAFSAQHLIPSSATGSPGPSPKHPVSGLLTTWSFYPITQKTNPVCKNYTSAQGDPSGEGVENGEDSSDRTKQTRVGRVWRVERTVQTGRSRAGPSQQLLHLWKGPGRGRDSWTWN